ncbi:MAG: prephenate dehydrogenase/arogenate dehydrogenase family protein [Hydrogenophilales bacterium CG_4_9_14_3_um_filter_63_34]|nr:MAG: prephenate dehydrogenase/arogenate dehydrogenase family protein [Hydrogenophilales bacterium CG_4_10_14_3_um_filter_63_21]PJB07936.1 MAG: prephenate dehydrogenase/arogenate dehydrogenase family protein [Hydrogenophilales bacterium CG_4_9_14_3_um_filter_63_34]
MTKIKHLVVIGTGLIGGSFALALKRQGRVERVTGVGRSRANLEQALKLGIIDAIGEHAAAAVKDADLVLAAIPVGAMPALFRELAETLPAGALLTDAGSTKRDVIAAARAALGGKIGQFIPGHPIAGAESNGAGAARAHLFKDKPVILTPQPENRAEDVDRIESLWAACGAHVACMNEADHDRVFAAVSHLPHLAAFALMEELAERQDADTFFRFAGSGFRDFTRIAGSHPEMWRDIALANRDALLGELDAYIDKLEAIRGLIEARDGQALEALFARARQARHNWIKGKHT